MNEADRLAAEILSNIQGEIYPEMARIHQIVREDSKQIGTLFNYHRAEEALDGLMSAMRVLKMNIETNN